MPTMMQRLYLADQYERQVSDFYPTPEWVTQCLLGTLPMRGIVLEPCAGQGAMAKVIADAGHQVIATDLVAHDGCVFPVVSGVDALQAPLPARVQAIGIAATDRVDRRSAPRGRASARPAGESQSGQALTTRHAAFAGRVKLPRRIRWFAGTKADKGGSPQHD